VVSSHLHKQIAEALLFLSEEPLRAEKVASVLSLSAQETETLLLELKQEMDTNDRGLQIIEVAGGFQIGTKPELAPYIEKAFSEDVSSNLSNAALEALAIIAYKQPVTRIEIESIRGVRSEHVLENLLKRKLVRISGRKEGPGRPLLYSTTPDFLKYFGLKSLGDLPELDIQAGEANSEKPPASDANDYVVNAKDNNDQPEIIDQ